MKAKRCDRRGFTLTWRRVCARLAADRESSEQGFTLIELIVVVVILPLVVGSISLALLATFRIQTGVSNRLSGSQDAQAVSAMFVHDVQTASMITTSTTSAPSCGSATGTLVLGLKWKVNPAITGGQSPSTSTTLISYIVVPIETINGHPTYELERLVCHQSSSGATATVTSAMTLSQNVQVGLPSQVTITGSTCSTSACKSPAAVYAASGFDGSTGGWTYTAGIQSVTLPVVESANNSSYTNNGSFSYTLAAVPRNWLAMIGGNPVNPPSFLPPLFLLGGTGPDISAVGNCSIQVTGQLVLNATSNPISFTGSNTVTGTYSVYTAAPSVSGVTAGTPTATSQPQLPDPYANLPAPDTSGLPTFSTWNASNPQPGIYTNSVDINSNVPLPSGVYQFNKGFTNSGSVDGRAGVLFYVTGGVINSTGHQASLNLQPLAYPPNVAPNLTIWQVASDTNTITIQGNAATSTIGGTIYAPSAQISQGGTTSITAGSILSKTLACNGTPTYLIGASG